MCDTLMNLRVVTQGPLETAEKYKKSLKKSIHSCGNVQENDEKMALNVNELSSTIRSIVVHHFETTPRRDLNFEELRKFVREEVETARARGQQFPIKAPRQINH